MTEAQILKLNKTDALFIFDLLGFVLNSKVFGVTLSFTFSFGIFT